MKLPCLIYNLIILYIKTVTADLVTRKIFLNLTILTIACITSRYALVILLPVFDRCFLIHFSCSAVSINIHFLNGNCMLIYSAVIF